MRRSKKQNGAATAKGGVRLARASTARRSDAALGKLLEQRSSGAVIDFRSLSEIAYHKIRQAIHEGVFAPNTHLTELDVAAWLQMSRTPVRDAMRRLMSEGMLANEPYRGTVVATLSEEDLSELYLVRELLEVAAAGWCALNASESELHTMSRTLEAEGQSLASPHALIDLNRRFHQEICQGAHNKFLEKTLATIQDFIALLGKSNLLNEARARISHRQHWELLNAIRKRDRHGAERVARSHVQTSLAERLKSIERSAKKAQTPRLR